MKRILVLGGAGFIGSRIVQRLAEAGDCRIDVMDDLSTGREENVPDLDSVTFHQADVTEGSEYWGLGTFDMVLHFASPASPDVFLEKWDDVVRANVGGAMTAASLLRKDGLLVLASSSEVYGQPDGGMHEENLGAVRTQSVRGVYDESKRLAESIVYSACQREGLRGLILRIFNTYGPGMPDDGRVINTFVRQARAGEALTVHGDGSQTRSFCYVDDTVQQIMALIDWSDRGIGPERCEVFNVGNPTEHSIREVAEIVHRISGAEIRNVESTRQHDPQWRLPVTRKITRVMGDRSLVSLREGISKCF